MRNVYEIVYYSVDEEGYLCPEYSKLVETDKDNDYMAELMNKWNDNITSGTFSFVIKEEISELNDDTFVNIINDLKDL